MSSKVQSKNQPGRPVGTDSDKVREALLESARRHFLKREFKAVSVREIAAAAGVNPAMVNYYFGNKLGLYEAMVEQLLAKLEASLRPLGKEGLTVDGFSRSYTRLLADNPWWPNFLIREVLFGEGKLRDMIIQRFAKGFAPRLLRSVREEIASGHYRGDLDPRLTVISLMGMTVFPFLARPVMSEVMGLELGEGEVEVLAAHNTKLFLQGVQNEA